VFSSERALSNALSLATQHADQKRVWVMVRVCYRTVPWTGTGQNPIQPVSRFRRTRNALNHTILRVVAALQALKLVLGSHSHQLVLEQVLKSTECTDVTKFSRYVCTYLLSISDWIQCSG
jgi:hypothetical protein